MAYREFHNESTYKAPERFDLSLMRDALTNEQRLKALRDDKARLKAKNLKAVTPDTPYTEDQKKLADRSLSIVEKAKTTGQIDDLETQDVLNTNNLSKAQAQKEEKLRSIIGSKKGYWDTGKMSEDLYKSTNAPTVDWSNRDSILQSFNTDDPKYYKIEDSDTDFKKKFDKNETKVEFANEDASGVTRTLSKSIKKPFTIVDTTKVIGKNPKTGEPVYDVKAGISKEHIDSYLDQNDPEGANRLQFIASKIKDADVKKELDKIGAPIENFATAKEKLIRDEAKRRLEKINIGLDDFENKVSREKESSGSGSGEKKEKNQPVQQDNVVVKFGVMSPVTGADGKTVKYQNPNNPEDTDTKQKFSEVFTPRQYRLGKDTNNMNPVVPVRNTKMYSIDGNKEVNVGTGEFKNVSLYSVDLYPISNKTGRIVAGSKETIDKMKDNGEVTFKWYAVGALKEKVGSLDKETGVILPLEDKELRTEVNGAMKKQYGDFDLDNRTQEQLSSYEKNIPKATVLKDLRKKYNY